jgi:hypothetical protein
MQCSIRVRRAPAAAGMVLALFLGTCLVNGTAAAAVGSKAGAPAVPGVRVAAAQAFGPAGGMVLAPKLVKRRSPVWAAYVATGLVHQLTSVSASWVVPKLKCSSTGTSYVANFVAFDGFHTASDMDLAGTLAACVKGHATYVSAYEFYPLGIIDGFTLSAGDTVTASATYAASKITLKVTDKLGHSLTHANTAGASARNSAEILVAAPSQSGTILPLADFQKVTFTSCHVNGKALGSYRTQAVVELVMGLTTVKATPGNLTGGTSFPVTWNHS